jgi:hypothetical protein
MHLLKHSAKLIVLVGLLCSCASQPVPNPTGFLQLTRGDAAAKRLLDEEVTRISRAQWQRMRIGTICYTPEDVESIILFIEQTCNRYQNCVREAVEGIQRSKRNMERMGLP